MAPNSTPPGNSRWQRLMFSYGNLILLVDPSPNI
jgi:hypothetical protein